MAEEEAVADRGGLPSHQRPFAAGCGKLALVSNINGFLHDVRSTSGIAHGHEACLYGDIIQGAGQTPIDVQAMGIDFAGCGALRVG